MYKRQLQDIFLFDFGAGVDEQGRFVLPDLDPARPIRITAEVARHRPATVTLKPKAQIEVPVSPLH